MYVNKIIILFTLCSCAHKANFREISHSLNDGLKLESYSRYGKNRLSQNKDAPAVLQLCYNNKFKEAFSLLQEELDKNSSSPLYWNQMGSCYILQEKYTEAKNTFNIAFNISTKSYDKALVLNNLGVVQLKRNNFSEAKSLFKESIKHDARFLTSKYNLSQIHLRFSHYAKAKIILDELLKVAPTDIDFLVSMAHLQIMKAHYKDALKFLSRIPDLYAKRDDISTNRAFAHFKLGNYTAAKDNIAQAAKVSEHYAMAQNKILEDIELKTKK